MLREDELFVKKEIETAEGMPEITDALCRIKEYQGREYYPAKTRRLEEWDPTDEEIYEIIISVFTATLVNQSLTYQALVGSLNYKVNLDDTIDRVKTLAEVVAVISRTGLIDITRRGAGEYILISTNFELHNIPFVDKHGTVYHRAQPVESNWDPEQGSMLLGGRMNHHEGKICLDHINRMNKIPMTLNKAFLLTFAEEPRPRAVDTYQKKILWDTYVENAKWRYIDMLVTRNRNFLNHKYCTRGRTYAVGYYLNTQGGSFKKASLQLANKEKLNDKI